MCLRGFRDSPSDVLAALMERVNSNAALIGHNVTIHSLSQVIECSANCSKQEVGTSQKCCEFGSLVEFCEAS